MNICTWQLNISLNFHSSHQWIIIKIKLIFLLSILSAGITTINSFIEIMVLWTSHIPYSPGASWTNCWVRIEWGDQIMRLASEILGIGCWFEFLWASYDHNNQRESTRAPSHPPTTPISLKHTNNRYVKSQVTQVPYHFENKVMHEQYEGNSHPNAIPFLLLHDPAFMWGLGGPNKANGKTLELKSTVSHNNPPVHLYSNFESSNANISTNTLAMNKRDPPLKAP